MSKGRYWMPYVEYISRSNPGCIIILIDQSASMGGPFGGDPRVRKCNVVADATNKLLNTLIIACQIVQRVNGRYSHEFDVGVIGYGGPNGVGPAFTHPQLSGKDLIPIPDIADNAEYEQRQRSIADRTSRSEQETIQYPVWLKAVAYNGKPMCEALKRTKQILNDWILKHMQSFPPIVINITDGEVTDGTIQEMIDNGNAIKALSTNDGNVLLFNVHISSSNVQGILFPATVNEIPDEYGRALFEMSSPLTDLMITKAKRISGKYQSLSPRSKGCGFNNDFEQFIHFLKIGASFEK